MAFNHENLKVYQRTLPLNVKVGVWTAQWDSKHALCDQLSRAACLDIAGIKQLLGMKSLYTEKEKRHYGIFSGWRGFSGQRPENPQNPQNFL